MARLLGFSKTKSVSGDKTVSLLEKVYLNRTQFGEFNTVEEVDGFINVLKGLPQTVEAQGKIAEMENKKLKFQGKLDDIFAEKNVFETDLEEALANSAQNNFRNLKGLIGSYAAIYGDASARYDEELISKIVKRYGTTATIPEQTTAYRKELEEKAKMYATLFNSYNSQDPDTGEIGLLNPNNFAVLVDTNPANGAIQRIDIVPSGQVGEGYMQSEVGMNIVPGLPNKKIPMYLRTNRIGLTEDGRAIRGAQLGNISYEGTSDIASKDENVSKGILTITKKDVGFWSKLNIFNDTNNEKINQSIDQIKEGGINLDSGAYNFDNGAVPNESVLRMGNRLFYSTGKDDEVLEMGGKNSAEKNSNLDMYLTNIGKNPNEMLPYFITNDYLYSSDGAYKVKDNVESDYFEAVTSPAPPTVFDAPPPAPEAGVSSLRTAPGFFSSQAPQPTAQSTPSGINRLNKPDEARESSGGKLSINDVVEKGKSFFRRRVA